MNNNIETVFQSIQSKPVITKEDLLKQVSSSVNETNEELYDNDSDYTYDMADEENDDAMKDETMDDKNEKTNEMLTKEHQHKQTQEEYQLKRKATTRENYTLWQKIKHFTLEDYMLCRKTRNILVYNWNRDFYKNVQEDVERVFLNYVEPLQENGLNLFGFAEYKHHHTLIDIMAHHTKKYYYLGLFKDCPFLAKPLIREYTKIQKMKDGIHKQHIIQRFHKSNKEYNWNTKKHI